MIRNRFLSLLLVGLLAIGLGSLALPEETAPGPHLYDGDEDDAAIVGPDNTKVYVQDDDSWFPSMPIFPRPEIGWLPVDPWLIAASGALLLRSGLTRAPPVR
jgi:hypothetical protein